VGLRRSTGKRTYPEVIYLFTWATADQVWPYFDGWCASRGVDHEALPLDRWLNLVYYFAVRNASAEDKKEFDNAMADAVSKWMFSRAKPAIEQAREASRTATEPDQRKRRMPPKPAGWGDDTRATFDNKAAIKTLTAGGVSGGKRRN
jgi:hypothetical protein